MRIARRWIAGLLSPFLLTMTAHAQSGLTSIYPTSFVSGPSCAEEICVNEGLAIHSGVAIAASNNRIAVHRRDGDNHFPIEQVITNPDGDDRYDFGRQAALGRDVLMSVGSSGRYSGKHVVYVFSHAEEWIHTQTLALERPADFDTTEVTDIAIDGRTAMIAGTRYDNRGTPAERKFQQIDVFIKQADGRWGRRAVINPPGYRTAEAYAIDVSGSVGVIGDPSGDGRAFVYELTPGGWTLRTTLNGPPPMTPPGFPEAVDVNFGRRVDVDGSTIAVGASNYVSGDDATDGAIFIYNRFPWGWTRSRVITAPAGAVGAAGWVFGERFALDGARLLAVGDSVTPVFMFERRSGVWSHVANLFGDPGIDPEQVFLSESTAMLFYFPEGTPNTNFIFELPELSRLPIPD